MGSRVINLTLHGVGTPSRDLEPGEASYWLTEEMLKAILDELLKYDNFVITLDDANQSDVKIVLPSLLARNLKAIFFITTGQLEQQGYLGRQDVRTLAAAGMEIGTHGMYHKNWRLLDDNELYAEIIDSKKILEDITSQKIQKAAFPYGSYDRRILRYLRNENFHKVYTSDRGQAKAEWWIQPRNSLRSTDNPQTLATILRQPHPLGESFVMSAKRFIKRWR